MTSEHLTTPAAAQRTDTPERAARQLADAVTAAGALALTMFRADIKTWNKQNDSPVTEADLAVDRFLKERLAALDPGCGWLSEETADSAERLGRQRVWIVDPIDGTRAFMAGEADWAVSAALIENGRPIAGALFAPVTNELFLASEGAGTTLNGAPVRASARDTLNGAAISGPAFLLDRAMHRAAFDRRPRVRSLALRLARVATAELDVALASANSYDWDIAAADIIVHEAGGHLTGYDGTVPLYNKSVPRHGSLVCAGRHLHRAMLNVARDEFGAS
ncbi:3'(2'),5'-bisphosphate nucleotidase CysQ [Aquabacter cavernae]|uniref:3'(2'),5'-bisphosphate nucleotidase CysQ n=1 Tax=Aquabacter cavernae TaxID=2496029 RepID=UPI000F8DEF41|nr:3'(2'),5'-bisphosphate nucleotidase CysQ [Aquabacter cavernae]